MTFTSTSRPAGCFEVLRQPPTAPRLTFERAIVTLGCPANPDGSPTPPLLRRLRQTLLEAHKDPEALIIVTGGAVRGPPEGPAMKAWLLSQGIPAERIWVEDQARFTLDNARRVAPLVARSGVKSVTLVSERYHLLRGRALLEEVLKQAGLSQVTLTTSAAPDCLEGARLHHRLEDERTKLRRDLTTLRAPPPVGMTFDPRSVARNVAAPKARWQLA